MIRKLKVSIGNKTKRIFVVSLTEEEKLNCREKAKNYWCNDKEGEWGSGLINTDDKSEATYIGILGETAFGKIISQVADTDYKEFGDKFDFKLNNKTINVKTSTHYFEAGLVRAVTNEGKRLVFDQDIYVFAWIAKDNVYFPGYQTKEYLVNLPDCAARKGSHMNKEVKYSELLSLENLLKINKNTHENRP